MRKILSQWRRGEPESNATPPLPVLPAKRGRRLSIPPTSDNATEASAFFVILPLEIRRKILIAAFGDQTIHLDLRLAHPLQEPDPPPKNPFWARAGGSSRSASHGKTPSEETAPWNRKPSHANTHSTDDRDPTKPRRWEWHSSICHRTPPKVSPPDMDFDRYPVCDDICHSGYHMRGVDCDSWPGEISHKCLLGIMGWLRACRAAYIEGVDVLYGTNRIHIQGTYLCRNLTQVILPERLACVTKVQLVWDLRLWGTRRGAKGVAEDQPEDGGVERYRSLAEALPGVLPGLKSLHLELKGWSLGVCDRRRPG